MTKLLVLWMALASPPPAVELQPLTGDTVVGTILELNAQAVVIETPKGRETVELARLAGLSLKDAKAISSIKPAVWVELVDGSVVLGSAYQSLESRAKITMLDQTSIDAARQDIKTVRFQMQTEPVASQWAKILEADAKSDVLVSRKADALDYHSGVIRSVTDETVQFELDGEILPVKRAKVYGLIHNHPAGRELPEPLCSVADASGSTWPARSVELTGDKLEWTTPAGIKISRPATEVARIDFSRGKIVFLSDLKPESVNWTPYFSLGKELPARVEFFAPRPDRSLSGSPLELDGKRFSKGLAIHSRTVLVYRLPDRFSRFTATIGIDDRVRPRGHVQLTIRGDDRVLAEMAVAGTDPAKPVDLDVTGVRRLAIVVDFGNDLDIADHLDLGDARLVK